MFYLIMLNGARLWLDADRDEWISDMRKATRFRKLPNVQHDFLPAGGRWVGPMTEKDLQ